MVFLRIHILSSALLLSMICLTPLHAKKDIVLLHEERKIKKAERKELIKKWKEFRREEVKKDQYNGRFADISFSPNWPTAASTVGHRNYFNATTSYLAYDQCFNDNGHRKGLAEEVFGDRSVVLKDILLTSKLMADGYLTLAPGLSTEDNFLSFLADTTLRLNASFEQAALRLNYIRALFGRRLVVGVTVPFVYTRHHLDIDVELPSDGNVLDNMTKTTSSGGTLFRSTYGGSFDLFLQDLLAKKGMKYGAHKSVSGLSDINLFTNLSFQPASWDLIVIGVNALLPTAPRTKETWLWEPALGTQGVSQLTYFAGFLVNADYAINPHVFLSVTQSIPATIPHQRVPQIKQFSGNTQNGLSTSAVDAAGDNIADLLLFSNTNALFNKGKSFEQPDALSVPFADQAVSVRSAPGVVFNLTIGNGFEHILFRRATLELSYQLELKTRDHVRVKGKSGTWDTGLLERETTASKHMLNAAFTYKFDAATAFVWDISFVVAGHNVPQQFGMDIYLTIDF